MKKSFHLFTVHDIPIEVHYSWFLLLLLLTLTASSSFMLTSPGLAPVAALLTGLITALLMFSSLVLHELGHSLVAQANGISIKGITLFIFGGVAQISSEPQSPEVELKMAVAGPLVSLGLAIAFWLLSVVLGSLGLFPLFANVFLYLMALNIVIAVFNLIPGFPLDGGRILRSVLWKYFFNYKKATRIASTGGRLFAYFLMLAGFYIILQANIFGIWYVFIGFFLLQAAQQSYGQVLSKEMLSGVKVREIMTASVIYVSPLLPLENLVHDFFFRSHHTTFPVVDDNQLMGLVTLDQVKQVPKESWIKAFASEIMTPIQDQMILDPGEDAVEALSHFIKTGNDGLPVVEKGKLIGILTRQDILKLLRIKIDLGE
jgi:Zn-dependent protease/CBS domain-containing protein